MGQYNSAMAFILTVEIGVFIWALAITFFFSVSVVAVVSKGRHWYELVCLFFLVYMLSIIMAAFVFEHVVGIPFAHLDTITIP
jgi:hypothetical protein